MPILRLGLLSIALVLSACQSTSSSVQPPAVTATDNPAQQQTAPQPADSVKTSVDNSHSNSAAPSHQKPQSQQVTNSSTSSDTQTTAPSADSPEKPPSATPSKTQSNTSTGDTKSSQASPDTSTNGDKSESTDNESKLAQHNLKMKHTLYPFTAKFDISVSKIPMPISATLKLRRTGQPDTWHITFTIDSFLVDNLEESTFTWNNCQPKSIHYHHEFSGFGHHRFYDTDFSWHPPMAYTTSESDTKSFAIPAHSVDDLTLLLQASCVFKEGYKDYYTTSIYGDEIRDNHFKLLRHEVLDTNMGDLNTLVIEKMRDDSSERRTLFWIAPALNYMLVKAKHIENPVLFGEVTLSSYSGVRLPVK